MKMPSLLMFLLNVTAQVELGWGNAKVEDIFFVVGYNLEGSVVSQVFEYSLMGISFLVN